MAADHTVESNHTQIGKTVVLLLEVFKKRHTQPDAGVLDRGAAGNPDAGVLDRGAAGNVVQQLPNTLDHALLIGSSQQRLSQQVGAGQLYGRPLVVDHRVSSQSKNRKQRNQYQQYQVRTKPVLPFEHHMPPFTKMGA